MLIMAVHGAEDEPDDGHMVADGVGDGLAMGLWLGIG